MKREEFGKSILIGIFSILISITLLTINNSYIKILLVFLPLIYGVLFIGIAKIHYYLNNPAMFLINCISAIRYFIIPILIILYPNHIDTYGTFYQGSQLMIFEAIIIGVFLIFITNKFYKDRKSNYSFIQTNTNRYLVLKIVVLVAITVIILNPSVLLQYNFFFMSFSNINLVKGRWIITGLSSMILDWGKLILPLLISISLVRKYRKSRNVIYYYLTILVLVFFNLMIFSGTSRNSAIMPATASMFFLLNIFPEKKKRIFVFFSAAIVLVLFRLTILKLTYVGVSPLDSLGEIIKYLEAYFLGPTNYGIALKASEVYQDSFTFNTLLNDLFGNFPGLSHLFNLENRTNTFYNLIYQNGGNARDAIIPSVGQGLFYFGKLFSVVLQMIIIYGAAVMDRLYKKTNNLASLYFYAYFAVRFGFTYIQNVSIILNFIFSMIIPISIFLLIDNKIKMKKNVNEYKH